ncbi:MAG: VCBS repeat-containing protein [Acidobacteriales bacterium]|nr:VCBS repeat-containing protein [Terriglobales bacterium]
MSADLNGDAIPDLAVVGGSNNGIAILLGNGDGTFQATKVELLLITIRR